MRIRIAERGDTLQMVQTIVKNKTQKGDFRGFKKHDAKRLKRVEPGDPIQKKIDSLLINLVSDYNKANDKATHSAEAINTVAGKYGIKADTLDTWLYGGSGRQWQNPPVSKKKARPVASKLRELAEKLYSEGQQAWDKVVEKFQTEAFAIIRRSRAKDRNKAKLVQTVRKESGDYQKLIGVLKLLEADYLTRLGSQEDLVFASEDEALQYLSDFTGKKVAVRVEEV